VARVDNDAAILTAEGAAPSPAATGVVRTRHRARARLPRIVVMGEFNAGKSSLVNVLLGCAAVPTGIAERTTLPVLIEHGTRPSLTAELRSRRRIAAAWDQLYRLGAHEVQHLRLRLPLSRLETFDVVDTPGLASGLDHLDQTAARACRRADIAVWCTPALQAWKASEQRAWLALPPHLRRTSILAVTYKDAIDCESDARRLMARLQMQAGGHFRRIVLLSNVEAMRTRPAPNHDGDGGAWRWSGGAAFAEAMRSAIRALAGPRAQALTGL
jgi:hypothetical protein